MEYEISDSVLKEFDKKMNKHANGFINQLMGLCNKQNDLLAPRILRERIELKVKELLKNE